LLEAKQHRKAEQHPNSGRVDGILIKVESRTPQPKPSQG